MAGDLIPPPSPAGKPEPEGNRSRPGEPRRPFDDIGADGPAPPTTVPVAEETAPAAPLPKVPAPHRGRLVALGLVVVALTAGVVTAFAVAGGPSGDAPDRGWSAWHPASDEVTPGAAEIAAHVGLDYRRDDGEQLALVQGGPVRLADVDLQPVTVDGGGDVEEVDGTGVMFQLNGLGPNGSIATGKPTAERGALVRREALELSLYALHDLRGVDYVVTLLPPPRPGSKLPPAPGQSKPKVVTRENTPVLATLYRREDLEAALDVPLERTLAGPPPPPRAYTSPAAVALTDRIAPHVFAVSVTQGQTGQGVLVLRR